MEGIYFFGEYQRWNLGWDNPNQAGAFVAMGIPWLWGLQRFFDGKRVRFVTGGLLLLAELALWFLLCKTYSRGALVAVAGAGLVFMIWRLVITGGPIRWKWMAARIAGIALLLAFTGFFSRIDPRFVSQDASAGNRLSLWAGGLRMIAAAPWQGWGAGNSGPSFMHWFQHPEADEAYAGMVNSYLHVGVERGLPVLAGVVAIASFLMFIAFRGSRSNARGSSLLMAAGCSWLVFLIANTFSTLWIFGNLWWLPAACALAIPGTAWLNVRPHFIRMTAKSLGLAAACSILISAMLFLAGHLMTKSPGITPGRGGDWILCADPAASGPESVFLPDATVLGETWGKEVRRLADQLDRPRLRVAARTGAAGAFPHPGAPPARIIACGREAERGLALRARFPKADLILVHPLGRPDIPEDFGGEVTVILPMLDTAGYGRLWKTACHKQGWNRRTSPGVGQDIRLVWPDVLVEAW